MSVVIPIISEFNSKGIDKARREFGQLETKAQKTHYAMSKAAIPAIAAIGAIATQLGFAVKAAAEDQKSQEQLEIALRNSTGANDEQIKSVEDSITKMMFQTATADDELRPAFGKLVRATEDVTQAQDLMSLSLDIAAGSGKSLDAVSTALSRAVGGSFTALTKLGIPLDKNAVKTKDLDAITKQLAGTFKGAAAANADTFEGKLKNINLAIGEVRERVGMKLIPVLSDYADILMELIGKTESAELKTNKFVDAFILLNKYLNPLSPLIKGLKLAESSFRGLFKENEQNNRVMTNTGARVWETNLAFSKLRAETDKDTVATDKSSEAKKKNADRLEKQKKAAEELARALKEAREAVAEQFTVALEKANTVLAEAQTKFDEFKASTSAAVMSAINFGNAQGDVENNVKDLNEAIADRTKAQANLAKAMKGDDTEAQADAMRDLVDANAEVAKAQAKPMTFFDNLKKQATKAKDFGVLVNRLIAGGISDTALSQVLDAGVDAGTSIATEILAGGQDAITGPEGVNTIVQAAKDLADKTGELAAKKYFQAGVDAGKALVAGIQAVVDKYTPLINAPGVTAGGVAGLGATAGAELSGVFDPSTLGSIDWNAFFANLQIDLGSIPMMADGGIVTSPTLALIGESGSEAVVPLDRMGSMGGGGSVTINVNGGDPNAVVEALRTYMRQNGSVPIRVSNIY